MKVARRYGRLRAMVKKNRKRVYATPPLTNMEVRSPNDYRDALNLERKGMEP